MKQRIIVAVLIGIILLTFAVRKTLDVPARRVHFHANFLVVQNGKALDFSAPQFMHIEPCTLPGQQDTNKDERLDLHNGNGGVAHIHAPFVKWSELFSELKTDVPASSVFILNGSSVSGVLRQDIGKDDRLLVLIGQATQSAELLFHSVPTDAPQYDTAPNGGEESCGGSENENLSLWQRFLIAFRLPKNLIQ
ncbi:MAG TPA: hypothetical protein DCX25_00975 [Candidatus Pacebacteria bacterium]|nr:MAG: hypothetical protein UX00_C0015G0002 [Microgenomates group bacterium GW2011_GWB1_45_17]KKU22758.1 MAG: hypothetical protein UX35_C0016G0002 [Microgenomates group bacterium GW2011_GWA1_46_15]KKU24019.1 MAG: hypothetical protein UX36_C0002G0002 [Microgenomates group bacterium GW2011_GWC1_46_15]HAV14884.1 hypothetical protein [Candidatus Paceibacterota bacterium]